MLQAIIGGLLFLAAGYCASLAFFREGDLVERATLSLAAALTVPALLLAALNFAGLKLDAATAYAVLIVFCTACLAYSRQAQAKQGKKHAR